MLERFHIPLSWSELLKRTYRETLADDVFNLAAQQAYYFFFALFPALLALLSIASFFPIENLIGETDHAAPARRAERRHRHRHRTDRQDRADQRRRHPDHCLFLHPVELLERGGGDVQHPQRRLRHHRGTALVEGAPDGDRSHRRPRALHPDLDDPSRRRADPRGEGRRSHAPRAGVHLDVEDPAMAAGLRPRRLGGRAGLLLRPRRRAGLDLDHSWIGARDDAVGRRVAGLPRLRDQLRQLQRNLRNDWRASWCCCSGSTSRGLRCSSARS